MFCPGCCHSGRRCCLERTKQSGLSNTSPSFHISGRVGDPRTLSTVTCDDGGGLASDLVLVHVLAVVQFPLHEDPGAETDTLNQSKQKGPQTSYFGLKTSL